MALDVTFLNNVTREKFVPGLQNQLYEEMPAMKEILTAGQETATGRGLIYDVVLARAAAHGGWKGYSPISTQESNPTKQTALAYANYYASVSISLDEEKQNSGSKEKLLDMLEIKFENAKMTLKEDVYKDFFDQIASRGESNTLVGLTAICGTTNTYAGLNRSTAGNEGWKSNLNSTAILQSELRDPTMGSKYLPTVMRTLYLAACHDQRPTLGLTTTTVYEIYQYIAETHNLRFGPSDSANLMNDDAKLGSTFTLRWDKYAPSANLFMLTPSRFKLFIFPGANFEGYDDGTGLWQRGQGQFAKSMQIIFMGQMLCTVPREQSAATSVGAS